MHAVLLLLAPSGAGAHFLWMRRTNGQAMVTFSESPTQPGLKAILSMISNRTGVELAVAPDARKKLPLTMTPLGTNGALTTPLPASVNKSAAMLEGQATWGLFPEINKTSPPLLQYYFSAHHATTNHDWFYIDAHSANRLSVTLRVEQLECAKGSSTANVVAVTRFDKANVGNIEVKLFDATGAPAGSVNTSMHGIATLKLPVGKAAYAMISHLEHAPGTYQGHAYTTIAHYATHSVNVECIGAPVEEAAPSAPSAPFPSQTPEAAAETARWMVNQGNWGYVITRGGPGPSHGTSDATPLSADVLSFSDGATTSTGRLFFYIMPGKGMDTFDASLTLSQAALNHTRGCVASKLDPEDPRCAKLTFTGVMTKSTGDSETLGKSYLFARHPAMHSWPKSHGFTVYELKVQHIWMIDFYGGAQNIATELYYKVTPKHNVPSWPPHASTAAAPLAAPAAAAERVGIEPPPWNETAKRARWIVFHAMWTSIGTTSVHLKGMPWGNVRSVSDGGIKAPHSTGLPVFYLPTPDPTAVDSRKNANITLSFSEAALFERTTHAGLTCGGMDAEDPTCGRLHLTGTLKPITSKDDLTKAKAYLGEKHPLAPWLAAGGAHTGGTYNTIEIKSLTFLDYYGGPAKLSVEDYLTAKLD